MQDRRRLTLISSQRALLAAAAATLVLTCQDVRAQVFAEAKSALVDYSKADLAPRRTCDSLTVYKTKELVEIRAVRVAAGPSAPAYCRVTGVLAPEIAFEVGLPDLWNGRFYMIGNGGHAGESLDDPMRAGQLDAAQKPSCIYSY